MAKNKTLISAQKAYKKGKQARANASKNKVVTSQKPKQKQKKQQPKQQTPTYAQKAYNKSQSARTTAQKKKVVTTQTPKINKPTPTVTRRSVTNTSLKSAQKAYNKGKDITYLGTKQKKTTTKIGNSKLESVNALTKSEMNRVISATPYGKQKGNNLLKGGKRTGQSDIREKVGSKTAESAYKSKGATGVMQGASKVDVFSSGVGTYNKQAKKAIKKTKESTAYNVGYGVGMALDMGMGGVGSRGASVAEMAGKGAGKLLGKSGAKAVAKKTAKETVEKATKKDMAKRFAKNRVGELVAESPTNVLDSAKMSMDADGKIDKKEMRKWLAVNTGLTFGVGGAMEGAGGLATKKLANKTIALLGKQQAGKISKEEAEQLAKNIKKLKNKSGNNAISGDVAGNAVTDIKQSAKEQRVKVRSEKARLRQQKKAEIARAEHTKQVLDERGMAMRRADNKTKSIADAKNVQKEARNIPDRVTLRKQMDDATERLNKLKDLKDDPNTDVSTLDNSIRELEHHIDELKRQEGIKWRAEKATEKYGDLTAVNKADELVAKAEEQVAKNPTPENKARLDMAKEAQAKATAEATVSANALTLKEQRDYNNAKGRLEGAVRELEGLDNQGKKLWKQIQEAKKNGESTWELEKKHREIQKQKKDLADDIHDLRVDFGTAQQRLQSAKRANEPQKDYSMLPSDEAEAMGIKPDEDVKKVIDDSAEGFDGKPPKEETKKLTYSNMSEDGTLRATTKEKQSLSKIYHSVRTAMVDNFDALEYIAERLPEGKRKEMLTQINELRRSIKTGRALVAERGLKIYEEAGLRKRGKDIAIKRADFETYCFMKHEQARRKVDSSFMPELTDDEIKETIEMLEKKYPKVDKNGVILKDELGKDRNEIMEFQQSMVKYFDDLLDREVKAGITSEAEATVFRKAYPDYVPTYRKKEFDQILSRRTKDEIDVGKGLKSAKGGSDDPLIPLFNQMQAKSNTVLKRTELNKTLNLLCMATGTTKQELDNLVPVFRRMPDEEKPQALLDAQIFTREADGKYNAIMYRGGSEIKIEIDKDVYDAIRRWSGEDRKTIAVTTLQFLTDNKVANVANTWFKKWITDYNLIFGVKNLKRDVATAMFYTNDLKGYVKNLPKAFALCLAPDKMLSDEYKIYKKALTAYEENGGIISQFIARDSATPSFFEPAMKFNPLRWIENFNSTIETIPRMAEFLSCMDAKALKKAGKNGDYLKAFESVIEDQDNIAEAMYRAKDVTLNFDRNGWVGAMLNRGVVPFFNPAVQGLDKLGRKLVRDNIKYGENGISLGGGSLKPRSVLGFEVKGVEKSFWNDTTVGSLLKMALFASGSVAMPAYVWNKMEVYGDDGEKHSVEDFINGKVKGYEKQSDYNRYSNYLFPIGDGKFIKIPKARELATMQAGMDWYWDNMKYGSGSRWERLFGEEPYRDFFSMSKIAWEQSGTVSPFEDNILAPIWRTYHNETWYGGKIESGAEDAKHREEGERWKIWDEETTAPSKAIGRYLNISPKKVDNILDSYTGFIYDYGLKQLNSKNDIKGRFQYEGVGSGARTLLSSPWSSAFVVDSVFQNANKSDYYVNLEKRDKKLSELKEGSPEYLKLKSQMNKDKNSFSYTSSQYDELMSQIYLDKNLTPTEKNKYARLLKKGDNVNWDARRDGKGYAQRDPMADAWNLKDVNGKRILSTNKIINACSYTFSNGGNIIKDAYTSYKKNGGKSDAKFMEVTLSAREVNRFAGDSLTSPRWEVVAYANELNGIKGSDKVISSYIEKESTRNRYTENAKIYKQFGFTMKNYKTTRRTMTQGAFDLGYDYVNDMRDGELAMVLSNARTKKGMKYRDGAYQANDFYILNRMNGARCLDHKKNGSIKAKAIKNLCDKFKLNPKDDYSWDTDKVVRAIEKEYGDASNEVKASLFNVITGYTYKNPFGSIGDYSLSTDTGIYCSGGYTGYGRRRRHGWGHGGGGGGRGATYKPITNTAGSKSKVTDTSKKNTSAKSNLDDAYRKKLKKLREDIRSN